MKRIKNKENLFNIIKNSNNLIISSDGLGTEKLNLIDLYLDENKPSFITHDPTGKLFENYKDILEENGYKVECINSEILSKSSSYDPLQLIKAIYNNSINLKEIGFGDKPVAVFLTTPDFEELSNIFIKQLYYVLAEEASRAGTERCKREVIFNLDNFESIYEIDNFDNIIYLSLARGIKFNITIKSLPQLEKVYSEIYKTILNNCGNLVYISSDNDFTNSYVSGGLELDLNSFRVNNEMIIISHVNRCIFRCKLA
ncbi:type IV secretory system conjugative DNA transfer family protein [Clostridium perfringens]|uniref:type IV secretory system conjugative DNA transfer family protein n=1 Tax=Clostridium perfringens TaxID=1502 RepID=UPI0024BC8180|nr:type IV secretory system conjugative DNA transfer family protein [Clostridium perfringens]